MQKQTLYIIIIVAMVILFYLYNSNKEMFATSPGTLDQLASTSTDPSWYNGVVPTFPVYVSPYPTYEEASCDWPKPWSGYF